MHIWHIFGRTDQHIKGLARMQAADRADQINDAYERMIRGDVKYRFVIDTRTLA